MASVFGGEAVDVPASSRRLPDISVPSERGSIHAPYTLSHPFVERLIGTIRRECLDRTLFWTEADLEMKLLDFQRYYNGHRAHTGLDGRTPGPIIDRGWARAGISSYRWQPHCRGQYQTPIAA